MDNIVQKLLGKVVVINGRYKTIEKYTGDNFNIFKIMGMEYDEVYTHSAIMGELLNVKGTHNLRTSLLGLFLQEIIRLNTIAPELRAILETFELDKSTIKIECPIGIINDDWTEGGRIDIIVESPKSLLIIENKINAIDQKNQLFRYYKFGKGSRKNFWIIYLTKFPKIISNFTTNNDAQVNARTINLSYSNFIINWLEKCILLTIDKPFLRETLNQYIRTVKTITNQSINKQMGQEIALVIAQSEENLKQLLKLAKIWKQLNMKFLIMCEKTCGNGLYRNNMK